MSSKRQPSLKKFIADALNLAAQKIRPNMVELANQIFREVKRDIIEQFRNHPISQELLNHSNPSQFLSGRSGTLAGFLGIPVGQNPVIQTIAFLEQNITPKIDRRYIRNLKIEIRIPTYYDLRAVGNLPHEGGISYIEAIENGVSGLAAYLPVNAGRSYEGIQLNHDFRNVSYKKQKYLTSIFQKAQEKIKNFKF